MRTAGRVCRTRAALAGVALALPVAARALAASEPEPSSADPGIAAAAAAVDLGRIQRAIYVLASFRTRHSLSDPLPSGDGIGGARAWLETQFSRIAAGSGGRLKVETQTFVQPAAPPLLPRPAELANVIATLPGTGPSGGPVYVLCAHYDSRGDDPLDPAAAAPGADDGGSGVAALLEVARAMSARPWPGTVVFLAASGGAQDGAGAAHWAAEAARSGAPIAGVIELDAVGNSHGANGAVDRDRVRAFAEGVPPDGRGEAGLERRLAAGGENDSSARELARAVRQEAARYAAGAAVRIVYRIDRRPDGRAPRPFSSLGLASIRLCEALDRTRPPDADTPEFVDFAYVGSVARTAVCVLGALASAPPAPARARVEAAPGGGAEVRWEASAGAARYRIVWRDTTSPDWDRARDQGPECSAEVPGVSPENAIFGVEAIDAAGHVSPAACALPQ